MAITHFCWRCRIEVPLLDEQEWEQVLPFLNVSIEEVKKYRKEFGVSLSEATDLAYGKSAKKKFFELTGYEETNANAIWHHRRSLLGPPCSKCGKLLRTPDATYCPECGRLRDE